MWERRGPKMEPGALQKGNRRKWGLRCPRLQGRRKAEHQNPSVCIPLCGSHSSLSFLLTTRRVLKGPLNLMLPGHCLYSLCLEEGLLLGIPFSSIFGVSHRRQRSKLPSSPPAHFHDCLCARRPPEHSALAHGRLRTSICQNE